MKWNKATVMVGVLLCLSWMFCFGTVLAANDYCTIETTVTPNAITDSGEVTVDFTVTNAASSTVTMGNCVIMRGTTKIVDVDDVAPGNAKHVQAVLNITADELDKEITLSALWNDGTAAVQKNFAIVVHKGVPTTATPAPTVLPDQEANISFTLSFSSNSISAGDRIILSFKVVNNDSVVLKNLQISDPLLGVLDSRESMQPGDIWTVNSEIEITNDFTVAPQLLYTVGGTQFTKKIDPKKITLIIPPLEVKLESSKYTLSAGDSVVLTCTVINKGNAPLKNIVIQSDTLGKLFEDGSLSANATKVYRKTVPIQAESTLTMTVSAKDEKGNAISQKSNPILITIKGADVNTMILHAQADTEQLTEAGDVRFDILVANMGVDTWSNVRITDQDSNEIKHYVTFPTGQNSLPYSTYVSKTTEFVFTITAELPDGTKSTVNTDPISIRLDKPSTEIVPTDTTTGTPEVTPTDGLVPEGAGSFGKVSPFMIVMIMLAIIVMALIGLTVALVVMVIRNRKAKTMGRNTRSYTAQSPRNHMANTWEPDAYPRRMSEDEQKIDFSEDTVRFSKNDLIQADMDMQPQDESSQDQDSQYQESHDPNERYQDAQGQEPQDNEHRQEQQPYRQTQDPETTPSSHSNYTYRKRSHK